MKKKKKHIKDINHISSFSSERTDKIEKINKININTKNNKFRNNSTQNVMINRNNDNLNYTKRFHKKNITSFNSETFSQQNIPFKKTSLLKKEICKRISKKDNNILVYIKGFKKHYGKEENCPLCITRADNATKRIKLLSANNKNFNNYCNHNNSNRCYKNNKNIFNELQDEIDNKEFHQFFIYELNKNENDDEILF